MADVDISVLDANVAQETTLEGSLITAYQNQTTALNNILAQGGVTVPPAVQAQIDALNATALNNISALTASLVASTPAANTPPTPAAALAKVVASKK